MKLLYFTILVLFLSSCAVGPDYKRPEIATEEKFNISAVSDATTAEPRKDWWNSFDDQTMRNLIEQARANNLDVAQAWARLDQSRSSRVVRQLDQLPVVTANGGYQATRFSTAQFQNFGTITNRDQEVYDVGFDAFWELDVFGRVRRYVEQGEALEDASADTLRNVVRTVVAEVAREYLELRGYQKRIEVTEANAATQRESLDLVERRFKAGQVGELDVARAKTQFNSTLALIPALQAEAQSGAYRIAVLIGKQPQELLYLLSDNGKIPTPHAEIAVGDPTAMIRRRPDVAAAERRLVAATAGIGVAEGDYFPKVNFIGSISYEATTPRRFGDAGSDAFAFGPRISWAAFDMARVVQKVDIAEAEQREALAAYQQSVLRALEEVESSLVRFGKERNTHEYLVAAFEASQSAVNLAKIQYEAGAVDFTTVIDAQRAALLVEEQLMISDVNLVTRLVTLWKSLGVYGEEVDTEKGEAVTQSS